MAGCSSPRSPMPANAPLIGNPVVSEEPGPSRYALMFRVNNYRPVKLRAKVEVKGAPREVPFSNRASSSGFYGAPPRSRPWFVIGDVAHKRQKPIYTTVSWQAGEQRGVEHFVLKPHTNTADKVGQK